MTVTWQMERAQLLRHAANTIRARAQAATRGPWTNAWRAVRTVSDQYPVLASEHNRDSDLTYAAMMDPEVGAAVAAWFDATAEHIECHECEARCPTEGCDQSNAALKVADLIYEGTR